MDPTVGDRRSDLVSVYRAHVDDVYGYLAFRLAGRRQKAEDLTQEVFTAYVHSVQQGKTVDDPKWLITVARTKLVDHLRPGRSAGCIDGMHSDSMRLARRECGGAPVDAVTREQPISELPPELGGTTSARARPTVSWAPVAPRITWASRSNSSSTSISMQVSPGLMPCIDGPMRHWLHV